jgi:hypothetical protein
MASLASEKARFGSPCFLASSTNALNRQACHANQDVLSPFIELFVRELGEVGMHRVR